jgi:hypothetical protein
MTYYDLVEDKDKAVGGPQFALYYHLRYSSICLCSEINPQQGIFSRLWLATLQHPPDILLG